MKAKVINSMNDIKCDKLRVNQDFIMINNDVEENKLPIINNIRFLYERGGIYNFLRIETATSITPGKTSRDVVTTRNWEHYESFLLINDKMHKIVHTENVQEYLPIDILTTNSLDSIGLELELIFTREIGFAFRNREVHNDEVNDTAYIKINDDCCITYNLRNRIYAEKNYWSSSSEVKVVNKYGYITTIPRNYATVLMEKINKILPSNAVETVLAFEKLTNIKRTKVSDEFINCVIEHFAVGNITPEDIRDFYTPYYENKELGIELFPGGSRVLITAGLKCEPFINGKHNTSDFTKLIPNTSDEFKIIEAIFNYKNNSYTGISPYDGLYHIGKTTVSKSHGSLTMVYEDAISRKYKSNVLGNKYFILKDGYYIETKEQEEVNDIEERMALMKKLSETQQTNKIS